MSKSRNTTQSKNRKKTKNETANMFQILFSSVAIGCVVLFSSFLLLAFALSKLSDPDILILPSCLVASVLAGLGCGFCSVRIGGRPMPYGIICGLLMILVYLVISLFFAPEDYSNGMLFKTAIMLSLPIASFIGATLADKKKKRPSKTNKSSASYR